MKSQMDERCYECSHSSDNMMHCSAKYKHIEPPLDCALEELDLWMAQWNVPVEQRQWLLEWSNRRSANVLEFLTDTVQDICKIKPAKPGAAYEEWLVKYRDIQFVASTGLTICALKRKRE